jgi:hypothetical protein
MVLFGLWLVLETWRFWHRFDGYPPDTNASAANTAAGAVFAGMGKPEALDVVALEHVSPMDESWEITWQGSPEAVERFVESGSFSEPRKACQNAELTGQKVPTKLDGCLQIRGYWRQPDGDRISRTVTWGRTAEGAYVVHLLAVGP